jgi:hypothetical protein
VSSLARRRIAGGQEKVASSLAQVTRTIASRAGASSRKHSARFVENLVRKSLPVAIQKCFREKQRRQKIGDGAELPARFHNADMSASC